MQVWAFTLLVGIGSFLAGFLGALTGLGGGVVIVPMLVILFGVDLPYAIGASLVSVIATSSGAASSYVREGYSNLRLAMVLEIATTTGALAGAALVAMHVIPTNVLSVIFGMVLLLSAILSSRPHHGAHVDEHPDRMATWLRLHSSYPGPDGPIPYHVRHVPLGFGLMFLAGTLSGLLGIGSGALKVLAMDLAMRIPFKVSTTTSNLMIGVTAAASAGVYLGRGYVDPGLALPVILGVLVGSFLGAKALLKLNTVVLRLVFVLVIVVLAVQMIYRGFFGGDALMNPEQVPPGAPADPDVSIDVITGNLLRLGVLLSALVLLIGGSVYLSRHATKTLAEETPDLKHFEPELEKRPAKYRRPADVFRAAGRGEGRSIIQIGVMLLVATPLLRVVFTAGAFAWRRDWVYVVIPVVVMAVLVVGIWTGQVE